MTDRLPRRSFLAAAGVAGCAALPSQAQTQAPARRYVVPFSEIIPLHSSVNGVDYELYVRAPAGYAEITDTRYPVIVTLDADYQFAIAAMHLEHLADRMDQAPSAILVSIAYAGVYPDRDRYRAERTRDYTPIFFPTGGYGPVFQARSGGGPDFLRMIEEEALPLIERRYRADAADRTLVGHSYGGLFAAWVLQTRPDLFMRYLMASPSLWYAEQMILRNEEALTQTRLPRKTYAYLGVGSYEEQPERGGHMVTEMQRFAEQLAARGDPNLIVDSRVFEDETHASIFPAAFSTGIRHLHRIMS